MKKLLVLLMLLLVSMPAPVFAADTKVTALSADASPTTDDLIMTVDDVAGTPTSKKVTLGNLSKVSVPTSLTSNAIDAANGVWAISNGIVLEGATADGFETTISPVDPTADETWSIPNFAVNAAFVGSTLTTNNIDAANSIWLASNGIVLEGATADGFEDTISPVDPTADQTISLPNFAVAYALVGSTLTTNTVDAANSVWMTSNNIVLEGATADGFETFITPTDATADRTITLPNQSGVAMLTDSTPTVLTPGAAITLTVAPGNRVYTLTQTDNQDGTITFSGAGAAGDLTTIIFTTTGTGDEVITFHATLCSSTGTLTLGTTAAHYMTARFISDGSKWHELSRTADQT